jgi:SAM-dependent methyltransferase
MSSNKKYRLYRDLAWTFEIVSPLEHYIEETKYFCNILQQHAAIPVKNVLHAGCGFGHNDFTFKKYFNLTGIDKSKTVLKLAKRLNPEVHYYHMDMRKLKLKETYDAIIAIDSLDYIVSKEELSLVLKNIYAALQAGGIFFFLLETIKESFIQNRLTCYINKKDDIEIIFIENCYDRNVSDNRYESVFVYIIREKDKKTRIEQDRHICGVFERDIIKTILADTGFSIIYREYKPCNNTIEHTGFVGQEYYPMFICLKQ